MENQAVRFLLLLPLTGNPTVMARMEMWLVPGLRVAGFAKEKLLSMLVPWPDPEGTPEKR